MNQFAHLMLDENLLDALEHMGIQTPTAIQQAAIPPILEGQDVLACAATGTGKTLAFALPLLQFRIDQGPITQQKSLILVPTRELAYQIQYVIHQLAASVSVKILMITGGVSPSKQRDHLAYGYDLIIATPGRLLSLISDENLALADIAHVVIDEADRMLDMGQSQDVRAVLMTISKGFQCCLFSATLAGSGVAHFAQQVLHDPQVIRLHAENEKSDKVSQLVYFADNQEHKRALLLAILQRDNCHSALVFCNKRERAEILTHWLQAQNISAQVIHGDVEQATRRQRLRKFRKGQIQVLVATDVAARGLDLTGITHVINYDMPFKGQLYIHRIGRTGRGAQSGIAISLVEHYDLKNLDRVEHHLKTRLPVGKIKGLVARSKVFKGRNKKKKSRPYVAKKHRQSPV